MCAKSVGSILLNIFFSFYDFNAFPRKQRGEGEGASIKKCWQSVSENI